MNTRYVSQLSFRGVRAKKLSRYQLHSNPIESSLEDPGIKRNNMKSFYVMPYFSMYHSQTFIEVSKAIGYKISDMYNLSKLQRLSKIC